MNYKEFQEQRGRLEQDKLQAEGEFQHAQTTRSTIEERTTQLATQKFSAVTDQERAAIESQLGESAERLKVAQQGERERKSELDQATEVLAEFDTRWNKMKSMADSAAGVGAGVYKAGQTYVWQTEAGIPPDVTRTYQEAAEFKLKEIKHELTEAFADPVGPLRFESLKQLEDIHQEHEQHLQHQRETQQLERDYQERVAREGADLETEFESARDEAKKVFARQDEERQQLYDTNLAPSQTTEEMQLRLREEMSNETVQQRFATTQALCAPLAERNVLDRQAQELENDAATNQEMLEGNAKRLAGRPDAEVAQAEYAAKLEQEHKDLENHLLQQRPAEIAHETAQIQQEQFPEIQAPQLELGKSQPEGPEL